MKWTSRHEEMDTNWWVMDALAEAIAVEKGVERKRCFAQAEGYVLRHGLDAALARISMIEALVGRRIPTICCDDGPFIKRGVV